VIEYLLDTNTCAYIIKRHPGPVCERLQQCDPSDVAISSITLAELRFGVAKSARPEANAVALAGFLAPLNVLPFDDAAAQAYGPLRSRLERAGQPMGAMDLLIAAHALALDCVLVTNDRRAFDRIPHLRVENWATHDSE
jgi:tRNA(fMet)-specific endonuclease VapC